MIWHLRRPDVYERKMLFLDLALTALSNGPDLDDAYKVFIHEQLKKNGTMAAIKAGNFDTFVFTESRYESYKPVRIGSAKEVLAQIIQGVKTRRELYNERIKREDYFEVKFFETFLREIKKPAEILECYQKYVRWFLKKHNGSVYDENGIYLANGEDNFINFARRALCNYGGQELALEVLHDLAKYSMPNDAENVENCGLFTTRIEKLKKNGRINGCNEEIENFLVEYNARPEIDFFINGNRLAKKRKILAKKIDTKFHTNLEQVSMPKFIKAIESKTSEILFGKGNGKNSWCR